MDRNDTKTLLEQQRDAVDHCVKCGACHAVCPTYQATGDEAQVARGRLSLVEAVLDGELEQTRGFYERISRCIGCMACDTICPSGVRIHEVILAAKADLAASRNSGRLARMATRSAAHGSAGPAPVARLAATIGETLYRKVPGNRLLPWWRDGSKRILPPTGGTQLSDLIGDYSPLAGATGRVALFPGCATNLAYTDTGLAAIKLLRSMGLEVAHPRELQCCGLPFLSLGDRDAARRAAEANLALLSGLDVDAVVTVCSSCGLMLKKLLPDLLGSDREEVVVLADSIKDIHELIADETVSLPEQKHAGKTVAWHDPCHMRHGLAIDSQPRDILTRIDGIEYIDIDPGCCGGAGAFSFLHYDLALKIGSARAEEITATGAEVVATGCPGCRLHLTDVLHRAGSTAKVVHTVELLAGEV
jgi:glycolate oxidase iron-sulfur subunit